MFFQICEFLRVFHGFFVAFGKNLCDEFDQKVGERQNYYHRDYIEHGVEHCKLRGGHVGEHLLEQRAESYGALRAFTHD